MKREDFLNTKWDARKWTPEMRRKWQELVLGAGFSWVVEDDKAKNLDAKYLMLNPDKKIIYLDNDKVFANFLFKERRYSDAFPDHDRVESNARDYLENAARRRIIDSKLFPLNLVKLMRLDSILSKPEEKAQYKKGPIVNDYQIDIKITDRRKQYEQRKKRAELAGMGF